MCCQPAQAWGRQGHPERPGTLWLPARLPGAAGCRSSTGLPGTRRFGSPTAPTFCRAFSTCTHACTLFFLFLQALSLGQGALGRAGRSPATSKCRSLETAWTGGLCLPKQRTKPALPRDELPAFTARGEAEGQEDGERPESVSEVCCRPCAKERAQQSKSLRRLPRACLCWGVWPQPDPPCPSCRGPGQRDPLWTPISPGSCFYLGSMAQSPGDLWPECL